MKSIAISSIILFFGLLFTACSKEDTHIVPSGLVTSKSYAVSSFDELHISDPFQVYVQFSDTDRAMSIEANENLHDLVRVNENNGILSVSLTENYGNIEGTPVLKVYVTARNLEAIEAQGAARVFLQDEWKVNKATITLEGASSLDGPVSMDQLFADLTGASMLGIDGNSRLFEINSTGASDMTGFDFSTDELITELDGGCELTLTVHEVMRVVANGGSKVYYKGDAVIQEQQLSGGSEIIKM